MKAKSYLSTIIISSLLILLGSIHPTTAQAKWYDNEIKPLFPLAGEAYAINPMLYTPISNDNDDAFSNSKLMRNSEGVQLILPTDGKNLDNLVPLFKFSFEATQGVGNSAIFLACGKSPDLEEDYEVYRVYNDSGSEPILSFYPKNLDSNTKYYWQVGILYSDGSKQLSDIWSFRTGNSGGIILGAPVLIRPVNNIEVFSDDLSAEWNPVYGGPFIYRVSVESIDANTVINGFAKRVSVVSFDTKINLNNWWGKLQPGYHYRWSVKALNKYAYGKEAFGEFYVVDSSPYLRFDAISDQQVDKPFSVTITAVGADGKQDMSFNGEVNLRSSIGKIDPINVSLVNGSAALSSVTLDSAGQGIIISAGGGGIYGTSKAFNVQGEGGNTAGINGKVKKGDGLWVPNADVYLKSADTLVKTHTEADENGKYHFSNMPPGKYTIYASTFVKEIVRTVTTKEYPIWLENKINKPLDLTIQGAYGDNPYGHSPVLLVPGIMGSSTGYGGPYPTLTRSAPDWNDSAWDTASYGLHDPLGAAGWRELIKYFEQYPFGKYRLESTMFPVPYDWRMDLDNAVDKYLIPWIEEAKRKAGTETVSIIAHSMGGLLVRAYIQSSRYKNDIEKFAMVGTPNHGSGMAYYMWQGGDPVMADKVATVFMDGISLGDTVSWLLHFYEGSMTIQYMTYYFSPPIPRFINPLGYYGQMHTLMQKHCKSAKQLLPTYDFLIPNGSISCEGESNKWLIDLNNDSRINRMGKLGNSEGKIETKIFMGKNQKTLSNIWVGSRICSSPIFYPDGRPISQLLTQVTEYGDGTVLNSSSFLDSVSIEEQKEEIHSGLIEIFKKELLDFITAKPASSSMSVQSSSESTASTSKVRTSETSAQLNSLTISIIGRAQPLLVDSQGKEIGIDLSTGLKLEDIEGSIVSMNGEGINITIENAVDGVYTLHLKDSYTEDYQIILSYSDGETSLQKSYWTFSNTDTVSFTFDLDTGSTPQLTVNLNPLPPTSLQADAVNTSGVLKTKLSWQPSLTTGVSSYVIYTKEIDQSALKELATTTSTSFTTEHLWSDKDSIPAKIYVAAAVMPDGSQSFFSDMAMNNDRDHDGLTDAEETAFGSDMTKPDTDNDKLTDSEEYLNGTNPTKPDTDGDTYSDYAEVQAQSDPLDSSSVPAVQTQIHKILTDSSPSLNILSGENVKVYGSAGVNTLNISSGAKVECINFPGANVINLVDDSPSDFTVRRSGATVYFESAAKWTTVKIPAAKTTQAINFNGGVSYNLVISNGKVMLGNQEVKTTVKPLG